MNSISELSEYLSRPNITPALLTQFLVLRTLKPLEVNQIFISQLHPDGMIRTIESFGISNSQNNSWKEIPLSEKLPTTDAIRNDTLIWLADADDWKREYPELLKYEYPSETKSTIVIGIDIHAAPAGALGMLSDIEIKPNPELISFVSAVSGLVALFMSSVTTGSFANVVRGDQGMNGEFLSPRQMRILDLMAQSYTNPQIAKDLGFSESTVRQETMRIYQILQVSGRKEAIQEARRRNIAS